MTDCDFNRAALHPAYPIKCRTSTQRTQAPESVDTPKSLSPLDPLENAIRAFRPKTPRRFGSDSGHLVATSCHTNLALVERESEGLARVQAALAARQF